MFYIGCHLSSAKGFLAMGKDAEKIGATTFQFFTRNPRGGSAKPLDHEDIQAFLKLKEELGIGTLVAHAPYTLNGCSQRTKRSVISRSGPWRMTWSAWRRSREISTIFIPEAM